jgi:ribosomal protein S18 acetylase RimI-like enzyme
MAVVVRPLASRDRDEWLPLWQGYLDFYETEVAPEVTDATWGRIVDPAGPIHGLGAFDATRRLVGIVHYLFHAVTWSIGDRCYLEDLFVSPDARGSGAGLALMEAVYAAADAAGADQVYWLTAHSNETARKLYDRVGRLTPFVKYRR